MKTAAIYTRVSSDRQKQERTIESQVEALRDYAKEQGWSVPLEWVFRDEGYSGSVLVRPGLERVRDLAAEGQLDIVLVYSPDRLSRKYAYQILLLEELAGTGTEVVFLQSLRDESPESTLLLQFQGMIAEYERAQIRERCRRGKIHKAKSGSVNALSGAPYGYRYMKKTDSTSAYYEVIEDQANIVCEVYRLYTEEMLSLSAVTRWLNEKGVPTRKGISPWDRTVVWSILKNPAYIGKACYGKTKTVPRKKITRRLRLRGGYSTKTGVHKECPREDWIEIPVPAIINEEAFELAAERLEMNKKMARRRTKVPNLLQGLLVCSQCSRAYYRDMHQSTKKKIYYYRCPGSDGWRFENGKQCHSKPLRQEILDELIWKQVMVLLKNPELIKVEISKREEKTRNSKPAKLRKEGLLREQVKVQKGIDNLLDGYQETLIPISELRKRMPLLRKRANTIESELETLQIREADVEMNRELCHTMEGFLAKLDHSAHNAEIETKKKVLQLIVREIIVEPDKVTIKHSIPLKKTLSMDIHNKNSLLRWGSINSHFGYRVGQDGFLTVLSPFIS